MHMPFLHRCHLVGTSIAIAHAVTHSTHLISSTCVQRVMGLDLPSGGHLTHGYYTSFGKKVSATSIYFESLPYKVKSDTGIVDYDELEKQALVFRPKMLICGASAYPRDWDYKRMRSIADSVGAYLLCDMAHVSGLVSAQILDSPFELCDVVTTTTHKSLRGPRAGARLFQSSNADKTHSRTSDRLHTTSTCVNVLVQLIHTLPYTQIVVSISNEKCRHDLLPQGPQGEREAAQGREGGRVLRI